MIQYSGAGETNVKVLGVNLAVFWLVEVLLGDEDTLTEEVLVDCLAVGLGNQPGVARIRIWGFVIFCFILISHLDD